MFVKIVEGKFETMKKIPLTQGKVTIVDDEDFDRLSIHKWHVVKAGKTVKHFYAKRCVVKDLNGKFLNIFMHREILGAAKGIQVDHKDNDGLNNLRSNIRLCTQAENNRNMGRWAKKKSSEYKGVCLNKNEQKWMSAITVHGKRKHLGYFLNETDAALKYDEASKRIFGDFARPNFGGL